MPNTDLQSLNTALLIENLEAAVGERTLLQFSDAPDDELRSVQRKVDAAERELIRRCSW